LGPIVAGFLLQSGSGGLLTVSVIMATGSLIAAAALFVMPHRGVCGIACQHSRLKIKVRK
jgi:hypothetical protein